MIIECKHILSSMFSIFSDIFSAGVWSEWNELSHEDLKDLAKDLPNIALSSRSSGTTKNYLTAFNRFKKWANNYEEIDCFPSKPNHVALYLTHLTRISVSHTPVSLAFYAIGWAHRTAGFVDPTDHMLPKMIRESAFRTLGKGNNKKLPVDVSDIKSIIKKFAVKIVI